MLDAHKNVIRRLVHEVFEQGRVDVVDELLTEDFVDHSAQHAEFFSDVPGREGFKRMALIARSGLTDFEAELDLIVGEGDLVAALVLAAGTHTAEFMGVPPTDQRIRLSDFHFFRFRDGKVHEHWNQLNALEIMQQLGRVPQA
ncbi:ester cyclase [Nocardia sp. CA-129566]|uniref:ester cyclase n=1 Tax=Nocardia sp. CA-129566 TaxID=3239976 RepID=UPI003D961ACF